MGKKKRNRYSLEREVIIAVMILYFIICGSMLSIHYLQPKNQITVTSSSSPSHEKSR